MFLLNILVFLAHFLLVSTDIALPILEDVQAADINYRLPNNTKPISYELHMSTNIHTQVDMNFTGKVNIRLIVLTESRSITVHQRQLHIEEAKLALVGTPDELIPLEPFKYDERNEFLTFDLSEKATDLQVDKEYILTILYSGELRSDEAGFYSSSYPLEDGSSRWLATTQFEATDARHGFPCYDEPALRAYFKLSITHGSIYHALSNMPVSHVETLENGLSTTHFPITSVTIPTYLIAFVVSDFESKSRISRSGIVHRVFTHNDTIEQVDFALSVGVKTLDVLASKFGHYDLPKMDQIAIPDFKAGAMENWGLVTYREQYFLFDKPRTTTNEKDQIAQVIVHEFAHQWFGNKVTPEWWTYLWLNEGFAAFLQHYCLELVFPEWKSLEYFVLLSQKTMLADSTTSFIRPMTYNVESPSKIRSLFDIIAYKKSAAVIHMFLNAFTEKTFIKGLAIYMRNMKESAAAEEDLFEALQTAASDDGTLTNDLRVAPIFASWSRQSGFPLVTLIRDSDSGDIIMYQERYYTTEEARRSSSLWWIPYSFVTASNAKLANASTVYWFSTRTANIPDSIDNSDWYLLNQRQSGYYRVKYDLKNYKLLSKALVDSHEQIHLTSRSQLIDDAFNFAQSERLDYSVVFDLMHYMKHESEYIPWASAFTGLGIVCRMYAGNQQYDRFAKYMQTQLDVYYQTTKTHRTSEVPDKRRARNDAINWSCRFGHPACLEDTNQYVNDFLTRNITIHQDFRQTIVKNGMRNADETQYNRMLDRLILLSPEDDVLNERLLLIQALAYSSNMSLVEAYLESSILQTPKWFSSRWERMQAFISIVRFNHFGAELGLKFLKANLHQVLKQYGLRYTYYCIQTLSGYVASEHLANQFKDFLVVLNIVEIIPAELIVRARKNVIENMLWIDRNSRRIQVWIEKQKASNDSYRFKCSGLLVIILGVLSHLF